MDYYTNKEDILGIIKERKSEPQLLTEIKDFYKSEIGLDAPSEINGGFGVLARHLSIARVETAYAMVLAEDIGLDFLLPTYNGDFFVQNKEKTSFVKPHFLGDGKSLNLLVSNREIKKQVGKSLSRIILKDGIPLNDFHSNLTKKVLGYKSNLDITQYFNGRKAPEYYAAYLALFGGLNCLFEDFHGGESGESLKKFTEGVFEPAFEKVEKTLGFKPSIFQMPWKKDFDRYIPSENVGSELVEKFKTII